MSPTNSAPSFDRCSHFAQLSAVGTTITAPAAASSTPSGTSTPDASAGRYFAPREGARERAVCRGRRRCHRPPASPSPPIDERRGGDAGGAAAAAAAASTARRPTAAALVAPPSTAAGSSSPRTWATLATRRRRRRHHLPRPPRRERETEARDRQGGVADARHPRLQRDAPRERRRVVEEVVRARDDPRRVQRQHTPRDALPARLTRRLRKLPRQTHRHEPLDERRRVDDPRRHRQRVRRLRRPKRQRADAAEPRRVHFRTARRKHHHRRRCCERAERGCRRAQLRRFRRRGGVAGGRGVDRVAEPEDDDAIRDREERLGRASSQSASARLTPARARADRRGDRADDVGV